MSCRASFDHPRGESVKIAETMVVELSLDNQSTILAAPGSSPVDARSVAFTLLRAPGLGYRDEEGT